MKPFDPRLLRAVPAARPSVAALAVLGILQGAATVGLAFALSALVVTIVRHEPMLTPALWTAGLFAARAVLSWATEQVQAWAGTAVSLGLRERLIAHWLGLPADRRPPSDRAATLAAQGAATVEPYAARFLPALIAGSVVPPLAILALLFVDWVSALIVVLTLPLLPFFAALIGRSTQADTAKRWRALAALSGHFLDVMRGLPTLVAYGRAERQVEAIGRVSHQHRQATMRTLRLAFLSSAALELLASISVAIVAVTVGLRLTWGSMDLAAGLTAILLSPEAYWPIRRIGAEFHAAADGAEALEAILTELDGESVENQCRTPDPTVQLTDVGYTYPGAAAAVVEGVSLTAGPGLTVVTGPSGAGKTTLLDLVAGLREPSAGTVVTGRVHYVTQRPFLPAGTLRDAMTLAGPASDGDIWQALRRVGLDGFVAALPRALDTVIGDDGFGLSAGQRARIALARALLAAAPVLLLDEPTAHLDPRATELVDDLVAELAVDRCVIAVSHRPGLVARADRHLRLVAPADQPRLAAPEGRRADPVAGVCS